MARYLVTTHRAVRHTAPSARDVVSAEPDVTVIDASDPHMVRIETSPERAEQLRQKLDATHSVEPEIRRRLQWLLWRHTAKLLRAYMRGRQDAGPYLFTGREGPLKKRQVQHLFGKYAEASGIKERSIHALRHSIAVHLLEAGRGIEYVADHLGHKNIQNTQIYAQITNPLREQVFRELEQHPKIVRVS